MKPVRILKGGAEAGVEELEVSTESLNARSQRKAQRGEGSAHTSAAVYDGTTAAERQKELVEPTTASVPPHLETVRRPATCWEATRCTTLYCHAQRTAQCAKSYKCLQD